jgi:hypothetical protein
MAGSVQAPLTSLDVELEPIQLVAPDGTPTNETRYRRDLPPETLGWLYEMMAVTRALDGEFVNLQRQGELAVYLSVSDVTTEFALIQKLYEAAQTLAPAKKAIIGIGNGPLGQFIKRIKKLRLMSVSIELNDRNQWFRGVIEERLLDAVGR